MDTELFLSPKPQVTILNIHSRPYETAVAAARTCYSAKGLITAQDVASSAPQTRERIAQGIYQGGHHTTFQHTYIQFALENVSRQFLWALLHSHTFYNSEQVSQRYVQVKARHVATPPLSGQALAIYQKAVERQIQNYHTLTELLEPLVRAAYLDRLPVRQRTIRRKALEVARYVLPVATLAYLHHTVSLLTVMRYWRLCQMPGAPLEQRIVVEQMVQALLKFDPLLANVLQIEQGRPLSQEEMTVWHAPSQAHAAEFAREFDAALEGRVSKLVSYQTENETLLAQAVRGVLQAPRSALPDREAIQLALSPAHNRLLAGPLNLTTLSKLGRTLYHPHYTFYKKLSHSADSQNQRHRMTPASRPLALSYTEPDYITPRLIAQDSQARQLYDQAMQQSWQAIAQLAQCGAPDEFCAYLLPNAVSVRLVESSDLLNLRHKLAMRLCYNAQEEIWQAAWDEAIQVKAVDPLIGGYLLPPCGLRKLAGMRPHCPEGERCCGAPVWKMSLEDYTRTI